MKKILFILIFVCISCVSKSQEVTLPDKIWGGKVALTIDTETYLPPANVNQKLAVFTTKDKTVTVLASPSFATIKFENFLDEPEVEQSDSAGEKINWQVMPENKIYKAIESRDNRYILHYTIYLTDVRAYYMEVIMDRGKVKQLEPYFDNVAASFKIK